MKTSAKNAKTGAKISVIIPVYNVEAYLSQCLESVGAQTYNDLEIIIVLDGPTDGSAKIAEAFARREKRAKIVRQKNSGLAAARNTGMREATGELAHFLDSDDYIAPDYYELMAAAIGDADMAVGGFYNEKKHSMSVVYPMQATLVTPVDKFAKTEVVSQAMVWRYLFRRAFLAQARLTFPEGRLVEDFAFSVTAVFLANKIVTVPGAMLFYRKNEGSIVNNRNRKRRKKLRADWRLQKAWLAEFVRSNSLETVMREARRRKTEIYKYRLFGVLPIMTEEVGRSKTTWKLFGRVPILVRK